MPTPRGADRLFKLILGLLAVLFVARAAALLARPLPVEYGEGTTWTYARLLATHGTYFLPIQADPYIHATYPPVFPRLQAALGGSLRAGRAVGLAGTLLAALALGGILVLHGVARARALLWSLFFLVTPPVHEWAALCRVDTLALGLSLAAVSVATRFDHRRGLMAAALLCALAFFTKQVALVAPAAIGLTLLLRRDRRRIAAFTLAYVAAVTLGLAWLYFRTGGESWRHLVTYTGFVGLAPGPLLRWLARFVLIFPVLLPLGLRQLGLLGRSPARAYALLGLLSLVLAGKPGAAANYLLEPTAAVVLAGALAAERRRSELTDNDDRRRDFALLLAVQAVVLCEPGRPFEVRDLLRSGTVEEQAVAALASAPGPVLSEDLGWTLAAGKEPVLEPFQFGLLARAGLFDPAPVVAEVRGRRFGAVVAGPRLASLPGLLPALQEAYGPPEELGPYRLWRRPEAPPP